MYKEDQRNNVLQRRISSPCYGALFQESTRSSVSALSGASVGEDDVFLSRSAEQRGETGVTQDWEVIHDVVIYKYG